MLLNNSCNTSIHWRRTITKLQEKMITDTNVKMKTHHSFDSYKDTHLVCDPVTVYIIVSPVQFNKNPCLATK